MSSQPLLTDLLHPTGGPVPTFAQRTFEGAQLMGPQSPARFEGCTFRKVHFEAVKGKHASLASSAFIGCELRDCYFGPATLDLQAVTFRDCKLEDVTFMLGKLIAADFSGFRLTDVYFRRADLSGASFRDTTLKRVSFERASLTNADFTGCQLVQGDFWGEPPWHDATVPDEIRYSFAIIDDPLQRVDQLLGSTAYSASDRENLLTLREWLSNWANNSPSAMIAYRELNEVFDRETFVWLLKQLRGAG